MVSCDTRMLSSLGYRFFNHPEICSGDQSKISLLATISRNLPVHGQQAALGSQSRLPSLSVRIMGTIGRTAAMAYDLSAHCRGGTTQTTGDLANRRAGSDPSRDIFSLSEGEC